MSSRLRDLGRYICGWVGYFCVVPIKSYFVELDKWVRRRLRACYWKQWRRWPTGLKRLNSLGVSYRVARGFAMSGKGAWRLSLTSGVQRALTIEVLQAEGLFNLEERWQSLASWRRTARVADPPARCCGRGPQQCGPYPDTDGSPILPCV